MVATSFITRAFALTALLVSTFSVAYAAPVQDLSPLDASLSVPADKRFCRLCLIADDGAADEAEPAASE